MKELQNQLNTLKDEAVAMMIDGKVTQYLAKLKEVSDVQIQMIQLGTVA